MRGAPSEKIVFIWEFPNMILHFVEHIFRQKWENSVNSDFDFGNEHFESDIIPGCYTDGNHGIYFDKNELGGWFDLIHRKHITNTYIFLHYHLLNRIMGKWIQPNTSLGG